MAGNMICPACEKFQPNAEECAFCGVVIDKVKKTADPPAPPVVESKALPLKGIAALVVVLIATVSYLLVDTDDPGNVASEPATPAKKPSDIDRIGVISPSIANKLHQTTTLATLHNLKTKLYMMTSGDNEQPPTTEQGLQYLVSQGKLTREDVTDPWGNIFGYRLEGGKENGFMKEYKIFVHSKGADGISGTPDDIGMP